MTMKIDDVGNVEGEWLILGNRKAKRKSELVPPTGIERLLSTEQVAALMCTSVKHVRRRRDAGKMPPMCARAGLFAGARVTLWR